MGAPFWSKEENHYFIHTILPQSQYASGSFDGENGESFDDLAPIMQAALDARGTSRRQYAGYMLFQHWYQKISPRSHQRGEARAESTFPTHPVDRIVQNPDDELIRGPGRHLPIYTPAIPRFPESAMRSTLTGADTPLAGRYLQFEANSARQADKDSTLDGTVANADMQAAAPRTTKALLDGLAQRARKRRAPDTQDEGGTLVSDEEEEDLWSGVESIENLWKRAKGNLEQERLSETKIMALTNTSSKRRSRSTSGSPISFPFPSFERQRVAAYGIPTPGGDRHQANAWSSPNELLGSDSTLMTGANPDIGAMPELPDTQTTAMDILCSTAEQMPRLLTGDRQKSKKVDQVSHCYEECPTCGRGFDD